MKQTEDCQLTQRTRDYVKFIPKIIFLPGFIRRLLRQYCLSQFLIRTFCQYVDFNESVKSQMLNVFFSSKNVNTLFQQFDTELQCCKDWMTQFHGLAMALFRQMALRYISSKHHETFFLALRACFAENSHFLKNFFNGDPQERVFKLVQPYIT